MSLIYPGDTLAFPAEGRWVGNAGGGCTDLPISYKTIYIYEKLLIIRWNADFKGREFAMIHLAEMLFNLIWQ